MLDRPGHGAVITCCDCTGKPLQPSRARTALEVLWEDLKPGTPEYEAAADALRNLGGLLRAREERELDECGFTDQYLIIRPVNPLAMPEPQDVAKIRDAIKTLLDLGMICTYNDND